MAPDHTPPDLPDARAGYLAELAAIGMGLARLVEGQARALTRGEAPATIARHLPGLTRAFDRLARTIRQTIALDHRLRTDAAKSAAALEAAEHTRRHARRRLIRVVEDEIATRPHPERENLLRDLHERLDDPEFDETILAMPEDRMIHTVAADLGIRGRTPRSRAAVATLNARAAARPAASHHPPA